MDRKLRLNILLKREVIKIKFKFIKSDFEESNNRFKRVKNVLFGDTSGKIKTFAIISPENPMGISYSRKENEKRLIQFKDYLRFGSYSYTQIKGRYGNIEHSFIIVNIRLQDAKAYASAFRQESFFFGQVTPNGSIISYYKTPWDKEKAMNERNVKITMPYNLIETSDKIINAETENDFYSKFGVKFRIDMSCFNEKLNYINEKDLAESLSDEYTFLGARSYRIKMRNIDKLK